MDELKLIVDLMLERVREQLAGQHLDLALTDDAGAVQTSYTYEPFGTTTLTGQANGNPLQYTGRENDGTGLYYYRARYYSPARQRFISEDPLEFYGGDPNLYAYVSNSPMNYTDPAGESWVAPAAGCAVGAAVGYGLSGRKGILGGCAVGAAAAVLAPMAPGLALAVCARSPGACLGVMTTLGSLAGAPTPRFNLGATPAGVPYSWHYAIVRGPSRNIPGSVVDEAINTGRQTFDELGRQIYYDAKNNITVVVDTTGEILSAHKGLPRRLQR